MNDNKFLTLELVQKKIFNLPLSKKNKTRKPNIKIRSPTT